MCGRLAGKRILIVEDEYFIAADLRRAIANEGAEVVGPVGNVAAGLSAVAQTPVDGALLDVNLEDETSFPLADYLREQKVPFLFLTGYDIWSLPPTYQDIPHVEKPFTLPKLLTVLDQVLSEGS